MSKTLAELRASRAVALPERTVPICLAQGLVAEAQDLQEERTSLISKRTPSEGESGRPRRNGSPEDVRLVEIEDRLQALFDEMGEHTGRLRVRGVEAGEWSRWRDDHPPRRDGVDDEGRPIINMLDESVAGAWCNASALLDDIIACDHPSRQWIVGWNDEPMTPEDWQFISSKAAPGDLKNVVREIVEMQEGAGSRAPKASWRVSSTSTTSGTDSVPPEVLESVNGAS